MRFNAILKRLRGRRGHTGMTEAPPQGEAVILGRGSRTSIRLRRLRNDPRQNLNPRAFAWPGRMFGSPPNSTGTSAGYRRRKGTRVAPWKAAPRRGPRDKSAGSTRIVHDRGEPAEGWARGVAPEGGEREATAFRPCRHGGLAAWRFRPPLVNSPVVWRACLSFRRNTATGIRTRFRSLRCCRSS
jgi:hypothetical protein